MKWVLAYLALSFTMFVGYCLGAVMSRNGDDDDDEL